MDKLLWKNALNSIKTHRHNGATKIFISITLTYKGGDVCVIIGMLSDESTEKKVKTEDVMKRKPVIRVKMDKLIWKNALTSIEVHKHNDVAEIFISITLAYKGGDDCVIIGLLSNESTEKKINIGKFFIEATSKGANLTCSANGSGMPNHIWWLINVEPPCDSVVSIDVYSAGDVLWKLVTLKKLQGNNNAVVAY